MKGEEGRKEGKGLVSIRQRALGASFSLAKVERERERERERKESFCFLLLLRFFASSGELIFLLFESVRPLPLPLSLCNPR